MAGQARPPPLLPSSTAARRHVGDSRRCEAWKASQTAGRYRGWFAIATTWCDSSISAGRLPADVQKTMENPCMACGSTLHGCIRSNLQSGDLAGVGCSRAKKTHNGVRAAGTHLAATPPAEGWALGIEMYAPTCKARHQTRKRLSYLGLVLRQDRELFCTFNYCNAT